MTSPSAPSPDDVQVLRGALAAVEQEAGAAPWANKRPWRADTHVTWDRGVPVVDLHDLGAGLAKNAVRAVLALPPPSSGAVVFVHGAGRHSVGPQVLNHVVRDTLAAAGAVQRPIGRGSVAWVVDADKAPGWVSGRWGVGAWLWLVFVAGAFALAVARALSRP